MRKSNELFSLIFCIYMRLIYPSEWFNSEVDHRMFWKLGSHWSTTTTVDPNNCSLGRGHAKSILDWIQQPSTTNSNAQRESYASEWQSYIGRKNNLFTNTIGCHGATDSSADSTTSTTKSITSNPYPNQHRSTWTEDGKQQLEPGRCRSYEKYTKNNTRKKWAETKW